MKLNSFSDVKLKKIAEQIELVNKMTTDLKDNTVKYGKVNKMFSCLLSHLNIKVGDVHFDFKDLEKKETLDAVKNLIATCLVDKESQIKKLKNEVI